MRSVALHQNSFSVLDFSGIGFSEDFKILKQIINKELSDFMKAETIGRLYDEVLKLLKEVYDECSIEGWDGYNSLPVSEEAYFEAKKIILSLPLNAFSAPEIVPESNGGIALEWYKSKRYIFVVSVCGKNELVYAGLFGTNKINGTEYYNDIIPTTVIDNLKRLYS